MDDVVEVTLPGNTVIQVPFGARLSEVLSAGSDEPPLAAIVNGETTSLATRVTDPVTVTPLRLSDRSGFAVYARSQCFLLGLAVHQALPGARLRIEHSLNNEIAGEIVGDDGAAVTASEIARVRDAMRDLVVQDLPIARMKVKRDEAIGLFQKAGMTDKLTVMRHTNRSYLTLYRCGDYYDYLYGALVPSTGLLGAFDLVAFGDGFLLLLPEKRSPHALTEVNPIPKVRAAFAETERWARILKADGVGEINQRLTADRGRDMILVSEGLHEKKISQIADAIAANRAQIPLVLIAGPSSSGKTTFSKRLSIQLRVLGLDPFTLSADDYFIDRDRCPKDASGAYDFESLAALDVATLDRDLARVLGGGAMDLISFDFVTGRRVALGRQFRLGPDSVLIVEGIHGLDDAMTPSIPADAKYRVYASALNPLNLDDHTSIYVSDVRTLRRLVRDNRSRGTDAERTLATWPSVRNGEEKYIFPFQEDADVVFNSSLLYELNVLKPFATPLLQQVDRDSPVYGEAMRMLEFLSFFAPVEPTFVPANSIIREFIGGSCFD